jgi:hypothetical protein
MYLQDPRNPLNFNISGLFQVECAEALYYDNPDIQNSVEIGDLAVPYCTTVHIMMTARIATTVRMYDTVMSTVE